MPAANDHFASPLLDLTSKKSGLFRSLGNSPLFDFGLRSQLINALQPGGIPCHRLKPYAP